jgi:aspartyl aminopeptidase
VGKVRKLFNENGIVWQTGLISKVDVGGGGTIALYLAALGIHIVDCGPAVLSMHSPFEVISKADLFATYEAYKVFFEKMK